MHVRFNFLSLENVAFILILIVLLSPFALLQAYGAVLQQSPNASKTRLSFHVFNPSWTVSETFSVDIYVLDAENICAWQAKLIYDPYSLVALEVKAGDFLSLNNWVVNVTRYFYLPELEEKNIPYESVIHEYAILLYVTDVGSGVLLLGGCRFDTVSVSGGGKVATVTFGIWNEGNNNLNVSVDEILLLDAGLTKTTKGSIITKT
ncbi:MAG: hypothetical protein QMD23_00125 [Candidatus Bathyarchaeia archaeon]|nr:hypothetical protein [Candidatus Bathyarchaeia archaeon]